MVVICFDIYSSCRFDWLHDPSFYKQDTYTVSKVDVYNSIPLTPITKTLQYGVSYQRTKTNDDQIRKVTSSAYFGINRRMPPKQDNACFQNEASGGFSRWTVSSFSRCHRPTQPPVCDNQEAVFSYNIPERWRYAPVNWHGKWYCTTRVL